MNDHAGAAARPIGVFDSGVGGLSVLRAVRRALPHENLLYVADSAHAPYGDRDAAFIVDRATAVTRCLLARDAKAIVVACNTASALALHALRTWCPVPVVGLEPAIGPATRLTRTGVVGLLATTRTVAGPAVERLCATHGRDARIVLRACPGLVENIERGELDSMATHRLLSRHLEPLLAAGADVIVLGCTHYAFLAPAIRAIAGPDVQVIDSADAVARQLARRLREDGSLRSVGASSERLLSNGTRAARAVLSTLWGATVPVTPFDEAGDDAASDAPFPPADGTTVRATS